MNNFSLLRSAAFALLLPAAALAADPSTEMTGFSVFPKVDLALLAKGDIKTATGVPMGTARFLSVQVSFVIPKPPGKVIEAMKQFDPTAHRELKVQLHSDLPAAPSVANFSKLNDAPKNHAVQALAVATQTMSPDLQISRAEAQKYSGSQPVFAFWADLLAKRAQAFVAGGAAAQPPYDHTRAAIQPGQELAALVRQQPRVNRQFAGFLGSTGLIGGKGALSPELYWELVQVQGQGVLTLGASYYRATSGGGFQAAEGLYYASGGYNVALTLYQLWPVNLGGQASTLVWRGDFISAASLGDLHGIERLASEGAMRKDVLKAATVFKREASR
jgi:hypothetical protein